MLQSRQQPSPKKGKKGRRECKFLTRYYRGGGGGGWGGGGGGGGGEGGGGGGGGGFYSFVATARERRGSFKFIYGDIGKGEGKFSNFLFR